MNTSKVSHQLRLNSWADSIRSQQQSGLNIKDWCSQNNVSTYQFFYWKRQLKEACLESALPDIVPISLSPTVETSTTLTTPVPTSLPDSTTFTSCTTPSICLRLGDVSFEVRQDTPPDLISKVIKAARHA